MSKLSTWFFIFVRSWFISSCRDSISDSVKVRGPDEGAGAWFGDFVVFILGLVSMSVTYPAADLSHLSLF